MAREIRAPDLPPGEQRTAPVARAEGAKRAAAATCGPHAALLAPGRKKAAGVSGYRARAVGAQGIVGNRLVVSQTLTIEFLECLASVELFYPLGRTKPTTTKSQR